MSNHASRKRSIAKAITYRGVIIVLDFLVVYLLTHKIATAAGFMIISNIYTTVAYFVHERIWSREMGFESSVGQASACLIFA